MTSINKSKYYISGIILVFIVFYLFLLAQFSKVFIYYDDYGYLSLSYAYDSTEIYGDNYDFLQLIDFFKNHYYNANGRLLFMMLFLVLNMIGGIKLIQFFGATSVLAISIISFYIASNKYEKSEMKLGLQHVCLAVLICSLYGFISVSIQRFGTYWFSATFIYMVPAIFFLAFTIRYYNAITKKKKYMSCIILAFISAFSQEQWIVATISLILMAYIYKYFIKEKISIFDIAILCSAIVGALPILTSPAVGKRMESNEAFSELSLVERIINNTQTIIENFFSDTNRQYVIILIAILICMTVYMLLNKIGNKIINIVFVIFSTILIGLFIFNVDSNNSINSNVYILVLLIYTIFMTIMAFLFLTYNKLFLPSGIVIASFFSVACLVIVPELPLRVYLPYIYMSFSIIGTICFLVLLKNKLWLGILFIILIVPHSVKNLLNIYVGYRDNYVILQYNDNKIKENIKYLTYLNENDIKNIDIYRQLDIVYGGEMAYTDGFDFIIQWMKEYYQIPNQVELNYVDIDIALN